jgi:hypothetical protein
MVFFQWIDYCLHSVDLGRGSFKDVYLGTYKSQQVAVGKIILTKQDLENKDQLERLLSTFQNEIELVWYTSNLICFVDTSIH